MINLTKITDVSIYPTTGRFAGDPDVAISLLKNEVYPAIDKGHLIVFDFMDVRNMNSSFGNALFANLVCKYGEEVLEQIKIFNTRRNVEKEIKSAIFLGIKHRKKLPSTNEAPL